MSDIKDGGANAANANEKGQEPKAKRAKAATAPKAAKAATATFERKIAKGYKSPIREHWDTLVDPNSENYAFLEVEQRAFSPVTGKKVSRPSVVSYNRADFISFTGHGIPKAQAGQEQKVSMKVANGYSINAVLHIPAKFNIDVDVDEWPKDDEV